ncbi:MAG: TlpA family protein disulfide reductase [Planctomycetes bacterium]|nr:TlpA family protein disulfide reductase [Planctomycetota bacterium]
MPHLLELAAKHKDRGLVVVGVHTTASGEQMPAFVAEQKITYPVAVDVDNQTTKAFAVDSYPDYYLIDRKGILRVADLANGELDRALEALLAEPATAGAPPAAEKPDAEALFTTALAEAKRSDRKVLIHVHGPG